jgi:hypothetical protein
MLRQANGGVGRQSEAGDRQAIEIPGFHACSLRQRVQRPADPPMGVVRGKAAIWHANRCTNSNAVIAAPLHAGRRFNAHVSCAVATSDATRPRNSPRWIFCVDVSGSSGTNAMKPGAL